MYRIIFDQRLNEDEFYKWIGKALFICQHFECTCKSIIMWLNLSKKLYDKHFKVFSQEQKDFVDKLLNLLLGSSINRLKENSADFGVEKGDITILDDARKSRNYICHESELSLIHATHGPMYRWNLKRDELRKNIVNIAKGDYLVSKWSYEFHEKLPSSFKDKTPYVDSLLNWVFN